MKRPITLISLVVLALFVGMSSAHAGNLSARAGGFKGIKFGKSCHGYRTNDCGKPLKRWNQQVTYRATNDTFVYRSEGKATARHDEISSPAIMFHIKGGKLRTGHVYSQRGN